MANGRDFVEQKDWENAKKAFEDALLSFQDLKAWPRAAQVFSSVALCNCALKEYDQAYDNLRQSIAIYQQLGDEEGEANGYLGQGDVLFDKGDNEGALAAFQKALDIFARLQVYDGVAYSYRGMEKVYAAMGDKENAKEARHQSEDARRKLMAVP